MPTDDGSLELTEQVMLTTIDNPYNPFTQWDDWFAYDEAKGYHSCSLLARVAISSDELSEFEQLLSIEKAIDEVIQENVLGVYVKAYFDSKNPSGRI